MTDAKRANWNSEGEKADRMMDDFFTVTVAEAVEGVAVEDIFDTARDELFFPILGKYIYSRISPGRAVLKETKIQGLPGPSSAVNGRYKL